MSEFKGTPGPWYVDENGDVACSFRNDDLIAGVAGLIENEQDKHNAQLIAAAPELLEALQGVVNKWTFGPAYNAPEFVAARAAIAKALGEKNETD